MVSASLLTSSEQNIHEFDDYNQRDRKKSKNQMFTANITSVKSRFDIQSPLDKAVGIGEEK